MSSLFARPVGSAGSQSPSLGPAARSSPLGITLLRPVRVRTSDFASVDGRRPKLPIYLECCNCYNEVEAMVPEFMRSRT